MVKPQKSDQDAALDPHILQRFEIVCPIGKGAYGAVFKAFDRVTRETVALKKIFGAFRNSVDAQRTFREISFLRQVADSPYVVELRGCFRASNDVDLYVTFELMESDVHSVIRANILQDVHRRYIIFQTVQAVKYLHSRRLIHRDLKPSNLLINSDSSVRLCDFGLARTFAEGDIAQAVMTDYVSTRWYRSPELVIGSNHYSEAVDAWALGCIVAELYLGKPLLPGTSTLDQMERIVSLTGPPGPADIAAMHSDFAETMIAGLKYSHPRATLKQKLPTADADALDFIDKLLKFNPDTRISMAAAIQHPLIVQFRQGDEEAESTEPVKLSLSDDKRYSAADYRAKIYKSFCTKIGDGPGAQPR